MRIGIGLIVVGALMGGCQVTRPARVERPVVVGAESGDSVAVGPTTREAPQMVVVREETMMTGLLPQEAVKRALGAFDQLGFGPGPGQSSFVRLIPLVADHFYARGAARTAEEQSVVVEGRWLAEGKTQVVLRTTLDAAKHAYVMDRVREALAAPAMATEP